MKEKALPEGWVETKLSDALEIVLGQSPESQFVNNEGKGLPFYQGKAEFGDLYPTPRNYCEKPKKIAKPNDILLSVRAPVGPTNLATENVAIGRGLAAIRAINDDYKYVLYYFRYLEPWLKMQGQGSTFEAITGKFVKDLTFIRPPLETQQKLAKKFTALLSQVAEIKQRLEKIPALLKTYRQSVLARAVNGELSAKWREENGVSLESWVYEKAQHICDKVQSGSTPKGNPFEQNGTIPFLKVYNIVNQELNFDYKPQFVTKEQHSQRSITLPNDVLMNIVGPPLGKVAIVTNQYSEWNINQAITLFRCNPRNLHYKFFYFVLREGRFIREIEHDLKGIVGQINISLSQCRDMIVPVPTLEEQIHITQAVEKHLNFANQLEAQVNAALERVNLMTQAILAKGFRGELL